MGMRGHATCAGTSKDSVNSGIQAVMHSRAYASYLVSFTSRVGRLELPSLARRAEFLRAESVSLLERGMACTYAPAPIRMDSTRRHTCVFCARIVFLYVMPVCYACIDTGGKYKVGANTSTVGKKLW